MLGICFSLGFGADHSMNFPLARALTPFDISASLSLACSVSFFFLRCWAANGSWFLMSVFFRAVFGASTRVVEFRVALSPEGEQILAGGRFGCMTSTPV